MPRQRRHKLGEFSVREQAEVEQLLNAGVLDGRYLCAGALLLAHY